VTARVDLEEFLTAYVAETDEHLSLANARVLVVEEAQRKGEASPRAVRDLFRALHTIKGLSAMVGVEPVVAIAHRMEAVLRAADRAGGSLPAEAIEPLVEGLRAIQVRVAALSNKRPVPAPPAALLAALDAVEAGESPASTAAALDLEPAILGKLAPFERDQLLRALQSGGRAVRLEFVPSAERAAEGLSINSVRERVGAIAEIVKVIPLSLAASAEAPGGLAFVLLLATSADDAALANASGVAVGAVRPIGLRGARPLPEAGAPSADASAAMTVEAEPEPADDQPDRLGVLRVDIARVDDAIEKLSLLIVSRSRLARVIQTLDPRSPGARELKQISVDVARQLRDLRSSILNVRMVRVGEILERVPLVVRGLRRTTGKQVRLELDPGEAELDKGVAERVFPALLHLVRNAVDHGIERPDDRRAAGKPEEGTVWITASARSNTKMELVIRDDGRGIDAAKVAARAHADLPASESALLDLLCRPGLSTSNEITTTSGRGMGMDIVKRVVVDELGGELLLTNRPGAGASFSLLLPLTIAIVDTFAAECEGERFVIPVSMVEEIVEIDPKAIVTAPVTTPAGAAQLGMFERRGEAVPLLDLGAVLRLSRRDGVRRKALVVRRGGQPVAFALERVLGQQEVVVRPLVDPLVNVPGVSGAADLGDGRPTLVLDLVALAGERATRMLRSGTNLASLAAGGAPKLLGGASDRGSLQ
jgi:two-component system chemotaxis sensor kinase CheA